MMMKLRWLWLVIAPLVLSVSLSCGGGGGAGEELLVVNQNILHGITDEDPEAQPYDRFAERIELLAAALAEQPPDIIFLQEVFHGGEDYGDVRGTLLEALGEEYTTVFGDILGAPIDEGGLGQLTITRFPVLSSENRHIGGVRSMHHVALQTESGVIDVYVVHLEGTEPDRQLAIDEIETVLAFIEETRSGTGPVILAGDFNAVPGDPSIQMVLEAGFVDALADGGDATCESAGDPGCTSDTAPLGDNPENLTSRRIDFIFVMSGEELSIEVKQAGLFGNTPFPTDDGGLLWISDHIGVQAVLELK